MNQAEISQEGAAHAAAPANPFTTPLQPGELNLVVEVEQALLACGLHHQVASAYSNNHYINDARGLCSEAQRFLLNRYWSLQLAALQVHKNITTIDERFCLIDQGEAQTWLDLFKEKIVPFAAQHQLPMAI
jgi:hypothetical protein